MNEELQSTNEELQTLNDELRQRTQDLNLANAFLKSILVSLKAGVVVIDRQSRILTWNSEAENLWGLRLEEVYDQSLFSLDIGLPVDQLRDAVRRCLAGDSDRLEITLEAINRRGRTIQCRISCNPLLDLDGDSQGVVLVMEEIDAE
jgi:two-component system CheB/CheR fusion protein